MTRIPTYDRYVNPYTDFGFKMLFGTEVNKDLLISFVNSLFGGREVIRDLAYLNTEHLETSETDRRAEGLAKGRMERNREIVRKMIQAGMDREMIVRVTGLTADEIAQIL